MDHYEREKDETWCFASSRDALSSSSDVIADDELLSSSTSSSPRETNSRMNEYIERRNKGFSHAHDYSENDEASNYRYNRTLNYLTRKTGSQYNSKNAFLDNPMPRSDRSHLTLQLLRDVTNSITTFKPSQSISALVTLAAQEPLGEQQLSPQIEIDVIITGGGMKGYYMAGASHVLLHELEKQNVRIARVAGASAGAWGGFFILTGLSVADWIETYFVCARNLELTLLEAYIEIWPFFRTLIPEDSYKQCSGRLFISITEITSYGLKNRIISEFYSNDDLFQACLASSAIPYLTIRTAYFVFRDMKVVDGGFTNNTPVFEDGVRRQLVFKLYDVEYPWRLLTTASDSCIEALVLRGAICMSRFLQGDATDSISWVERREKKALTSQARSSSGKPGVYLRMIVTPLIVAGMVALHGLGLAQYQLRLQKKRKGMKRVTSTIIPFEQVSEERDSPLSYLRRIIWGSLIDVLGQMGVLL